MRKVISNKLKPVIVFIIFVLICAILHLNLLLPWQILNRKNRKAMLSYIDKNYPKAKIIEKSYHFPDFWAPNPDDGLQVRWNDVEFWIYAGSGEISVDTYAEKQKFTDLVDLVYHGFCVPYSARTVSHLSAAEMRPAIVCKAEDGSTVTDFYDHDGKLLIDVYIDQNTERVSDIDWLRDFCFYMNHRFASHLGRRDYEYQVNVKLASGVTLQRKFEFGNPLGGEHFSELFN